MEPLITWSDLGVAFLIIKDGEKPKHFYFEALDCRKYPGLARMFAGTENSIKKRSMKKTRKNLPVQRLLLHNLIIVKQTHY